MGAHKARALVIRTAGTNCDAEMVRAFELAGAAADLVHLDRLVAEPQRVDEYDLIGFPGGFSYGDDVASGRIFAMRLRERLYPALRSAAARGCAMIGACNGFQVLVQVGLLPGPMGGAAGGGGGGWPEEPPPQTCSLSFNVGGRFIDRWVRVEPNASSQCIWTRHLNGEFGGANREAVMRLPIAHGEGRFVTSSPAVFEALERGGQIALRYAPEDNPNGSMESAVGSGGSSKGGVAGICDASGRIFGLMPHPERYLEWTHHPFWTRLDDSARRGDTPGLSMFKAAVEAVSPVRA